MFYKKNSYESIMHKRRTKYINMKVITKEYLRFTMTWSNHVVEKIFPRISVKNLYFNDIFFLLFAFANAYKQKRNIQSEQT
jgi:hypothetical protein